jgi:hypothetical protein
MRPLSTEHHLSDRKIGCGHTFDYAVSECPPALLQTSQRNEVLKMACLGSPRECSAYREMRISGETDGV